MRIWIVPMKGKGLEVTARNIVLADEADECRPLTTDPDDNVMVYEEYWSMMNVNKRLGLMLKKVVDNKIGGGQYLLDCYNLIVLKDIACTITTRVNQSSDKFVMDVYDGEVEDKGSD